MIEFNNGIKLYGNVKNMQDDNELDRQFKGYCVRNNLVDKETRLDFLRDNFGEYWLIHAEFSNSQNPILRIPQFVRGIVSKGVVIGDLNRDILQHVTDDWVKRFDKEEWNADDTLEVEQLNFIKINKFNKSFIWYRNPEGTITIAGNGKPLDVQTANLFETVTAKNIVFKNLNLQKKEDATHMFQNSKISHIDISGIDFGKIKSIRSMFYNCGVSGTVDLTQLDLSECKVLRNCFFWCVLLEEVKLPEQKLPDGADISCMFQGCSILKKANTESLICEDVTRMFDMFTECDELEHIDVRNIQKVDELFNIVSLAVFSPKLKSITLDKKIAMGERLDVLEQKIIKKTGQPDLKIYWV